MPRGQRTSYEIKAKVQELVSEGRGPTEIYRHLKSIEKRNPAELGGNGRVPSESTINGLVRELKPNDPSGPWMFLRASSVQKRLVPEVLSHVFYKTEGRVWLSNELAEFVTQVRMSCPDIPLEWAYRYARMFQVAKNDPDSEWLVILTLGKRPWEAGDDGWKLVDQLGETAVELASWEKFQEEYNVHDERSYQATVKDVPEPPTIGENEAAPRIARLLRPN